MIFFCNFSTCSEENEHFLNFPELLIHINKQHLKVEPIFICPLCSKRFECYEKFIYHICDYIHRYINSTNNFLEIYEFPKKNKSFKKSLEIIPVNLEKSDFPKTSTSVKKRNKNHLENVESNSSAIKMIDDLLKAPIHFRIRDGFNVKVFSSGTIQFYGTGIAQITENLPDYILNYFDSKYTIRDIKSMTQYINFIIRKFKM